MNSKGGIIYNEYLKIFRACPLVLQSWLYPRLTAFEDLIGDRWHDIPKKSLVESKLEEIPSNLICTVEDIPCDVLIADLGDKYFLIEFEEMAKNTNKDDKNNKRKLLFRVVEEPETELDSKEKMCYHNFTQYLNKQRKHIPKPIIFEKIYKE